MNKLNNDKKIFEMTGNWSANDDLCDAAVKYWALFNFHYFPLYKEYEKAIDLFLRSNDVSGANRLTAEKIRLETKIPGRPLFVSNSAWQGRRHGPHGLGGSIRLEIQRITGNLYDGTHPTLFGPFNPGFPRAL